MPSFRAELAETFQSGPFRWSPTSGWLLAKDVTLTGDLMRRLAALWLLLALPASLLAAPFHHVHEPGHAREHVAKHHSGSLALHLHFGGRFSDRTVWTPEIESSARSLSLFRVDLTDPFVYAVLIESEPFDFDADLVHHGWIRDNDHRIHDPPRIGTCSPRAPPV